MFEIRILVVDDSVVNRQMLKKSLSSIDGFDVVGVAHNGKLALAKIPQINPDIIILDIEMPDMDGLETLKEIRSQYGSLPVIMFSALTEKGASITVQALAMGANDYVPKPDMSNFRVKAESEDYILTQLEPRIRALVKKHQKPPFSDTPYIRAKDKQISSKALKVKRKAEVVGLGISTGGPNALARVFEQFLGPMTVPLLIVQHMPPIFTKYLAERLDQISEIKVVEAEDGMPLKENWAYIAPGDYHMSLNRSESQVLISLNQTPPENACRPSVDVLFRSIAEIYGGASLGVVMTGMGQDGFRGCEALNHVGGHIFAQDEKSSVIWGMPGFIVKSGLADKVLPLDKIAQAIFEHIVMGHL